MILLMLCLSCIFPVRHKEIDKIADEISGGVRSCLTIDKSSLNNHQVRTSATAHLKF